MLVVVTHCSVLQNLQKKQNVKKKKKKHLQKQLNNNLLPDLKDDENFSVIYLTLKLMVMRVADKDFMLNFSELEENENNAKVDTKKIAQMIIIL